MGFISYCLRSLLTERFELQGSEMFFSVCTDPRVFFRLELCFYLFVCFFCCCCFFIGWGGGGGAGNLLGFFFFFFNFDRLLSPFVGLATWCREVKFDVNFA